MAYSTNFQDFKLNLFCRVHISIFVTCFTNLNIFFGMHAIFLTDHMITPQSKIQQVTAHVVDKLTESPMIHEKIDAEAQTSIIVWK